ncbi:hypothetical protein C8J57DRAFT_1479255 [Mycena rebaudengoi]|nr:hypothetical protein C8J57DRAFT_1479255 [Mycena rebaudengoi]
MCEERLAQDPRTAGWFHANPHDYDVTSIIWQIKTVRADLTVASYGCRACAVMNINDMHAFTRPPRLVAFSVDYNRAISRKNLLSIHFTVIKPAALSANMYTYVYNCHPLQRRGSKENCLTNGQTAKACQPSVKLRSTPSKTTLWRICSHLWQKTVASVHTESE